MKEDDFIDIYNIYQLMQIYKNELEEVEKYRKEVEEKKHPLFFSIPYTNLSQIKISHDDVIKDILNIIKIYFQNELKELENKFKNIEVRI